MKKLFKYTIIALLFYQCKEEKVTPKPDADFSASITEIDEGEMVQFSDQSSNLPTTWLWSFGDGSTSTLQNPSHSYASAGIYTVTLTAGNSSGDDMVSKTDYITVIQTTNLTFINNVFTDIHITLNGDEKTVAPEETVSYENVRGATAVFSAYTNGKNTEGDLVGVRIDWGKTLDLSGGNDNFNLNAGGDKFFIYMRNSSSHNLENLTVNYGLSDQTQDNVRLPNDDVLYRAGYYNVHANTSARMYWEDDNTMYAYWNQGTHFTLTTELNQYVILTYSDKKSNVQTSFPVGYEKTCLLEPAGLNVAKPKFSTNAIDLISR